MDEAQKRSLAARGAVCRPIGWTLYGRRKWLRIHRDARRGAPLDITTYLPPVAREVWGPQ